ncbi:hypothetical protein TIFTF001_023213 [Ficus carica]|uniref:Uncharacterized protein n=1 Tax=Ficus carica TaxID=3494 RepID=A0AA88DK49_FICCA|nr:hypothetical protein TIFTF001_023213 [Ficus carica]
MKFPTEFGVGQIKSSQYEARMGYVEALHELDEVSSNVQHFNMILGTRMQDDLDPQ